MAPDGERERRVLEGVRKSMRTIRTILGAAGDRGIQRIYT